MMSGQSFIIKVIKQQKYGSEAIYLSRKNVSWLFQNIKVIAFYDVRNL